MVPGLKSKFTSIFIFFLTITLFSVCSFEQKKTKELVFISETDLNSFQEGNSKFKNGDYLEAIEFYSRDLDVNPDNPTSLNNRGLAKSKSGNETGAISDYNRAIEKREDYAIAFNNRGCAKMKVSDYRGAIEDLSLAIRLKPTYANALNNRAVVNWTVQEQQSACEDWKKAANLGHNEARKSFVKFCS
ncbi:tetratricopeptide repeat protein [Leptospira mayottensis]|uniref:tetratricopeptide repeat protein n=1 Tax=Leptospira mayottensis TaxID=1137606 RepID=UPI0002BE8E67|nr:tetratricopeptide repeat protein [Leptospira mayottensis]AXR62620.1 tetratricopeptide repeat protein [Leptospira mayottensis]AZQ04003.1 tetratricopeptide repeat protein [Leptospira mayottensis 200901116]TGM89716.1 tetratricopeptide repeat protein [Leptospira mayottensis]